MDGEGAAQWSQHLQERVGRDRAINSAPSGGSRTEETQRSHIPPAASARSSSSRKGSKSAQVPRWEEQEQPEGTFFMNWKPANLHSLWASVPTGGSIQTNFSFSPHFSKMKHFSDLGPPNPTCPQEKLSSELREPIKLLQAWCCFYEQVREEPFSQKTGPSPLLRRESIVFEQRLREPAGKADTHLQMVLLRKERTLTTNMRKSPAEVRKVTLAQAENPPRRGKETKTAGNSSAGKEPFGQR